MITEKLVKAHIESINVYLPSSISQFSKPSKYVKYLEYSSYTKGYSITYKLGKSFYHTDKFIDDILFNNLLSYLNSSEESTVNLLIEETDDYNKVILKNIEFPEDYVLTQYIDTLSFTPLNLYSKSCSNSKFKEYLSSVTEQFNILGCYDYTNSINKSFSVSIFHNRKLHNTKYSELKPIEVETILSAIINSRPIKARFKITKTTMTLLEVLI